MDMRRFVVALALAVVALPAAAQDFAGKWDLAMEGVGTVATFDFIVEGDVLKGTASSPDGTATPIADGKIEGNKITFKQNVEGGPAGAMTIGFTGVLEGDKIALSLDLGEAAAGAPPFEVPPMFLTRIPQQ